MNSRPPDIWEKRHYVYEFYTADGTCLYVGLTSQVGARIQKHITETRWWPEVVRIELSRHDGLRAGSIAERDRIQALQPVHNIQFTDKPPANGWATRRANSARKLKEIRSRATNHP